MKLRKSFALFAVLTLLVGLAPQAQAAPTVSADSAGAKSVGYSTYVWGAVAAPGGQDVWTEVLVGDRWSRSQVGRTDNTGRYTLELTYGFNSLGSYRFRVGANAGSGVVYSNDFTLTRTPWEVSSAGTKPVGETTNVWSTIPAAAGRTIWTEALVNGRWSRSQVRAADASGCFAIPLTYGTSEPGRYTFRVVASTARGDVTSQEFVLERTGGTYSVDAYSAGTKEINQTTFAWGTVQGHAGGRVWTEALVGGNWSTSQITTSDSSGRYTLPLTYGSSTPGTYTFRVGASTPSGTVYSNQISLERLAPAVTVPAVPVGASGQLLDAVNKARAAGATCGSMNMPPAPALAWNDRLGQAATRHSNDMANRNFVSHTGSDGSSMSQRASDAGYRWRTVAENVAAGQRTVDEVMDGWMKSDGHCRNIMNPSFTEFGADLSTNDNSTYGIYWTQSFAAPL